MITYQIWTQNSSALRYLVSSLGSLRFGFGLGAVHISPHDSLELEVVDLSAVISIQLFKNFFDFVVIHVNSAVSYVF